MATPFATASDLAARLKRPVWTDPLEVEQVEQFLADASNDLRAEIGWQVWPPVAVTVELSPDSLGHVRLPGAPIADISSVTQGGSVVASDGYEWFGCILHLPGLYAVSVTYTVGYSEPPPDLIRWTCVIAAQMLARAADDKLGGVPEAEALADYRISYSDQQQLGDLPVPPRVLDRLRSTYGTGVYTT